MLVPLYCEGPDPVRLPKSALLLLSLVASAAAARAGHGEKSRCAERADLVGPCFDIRGRVSLANGNPTVRIWRVGTARILGVVGVKCDEPPCGPHAMPDSLWMRMTWHKDVFADLTVCPITKEREAWMQMVCIDSARNAVERSRMPPPPASDLSFGPRCKSDGDCKAGQEFARWGSFAGPNPRRTCEIPCNRSHPCANGLRCNYFEDDGPYTALRGVCLPH